jgi:hypothetical protein
MSVLVIGRFPLAGRCLRQPNAYSIDFGAARPRSSAGMMERVAGAAGRRSGRFGVLDLDMQLQACGGSNVDKSIQRELVELAA